MYENADSTWARGGQKTADPTNGMLVRLAGNLSDGVVGALRGPALPAPQRMVARDRRAEAGLGTRCDSIDLQEEPKPPVRSMFRGIFSIHNRK